MAFSKGDVVRLKSGGPSMTVDDVYRDGRVYCVWFVGSKEKMGLFAAESLQVATEELAPRATPHTGVWS